MPGALRREQLAAASLVGMVVVIVGFASGPGTGHGGTAAPATATTGSSIGGTSDHGLALGPGVASDPSTPSLSDGTLDASRMPAWSLGAPPDAPPDSPAASTGSPSRVTSGAGS